MYYFYRSILDDNKNLTNKDRYIRGMKLARLINGIVFGTLTFMFLVTSLILDSIDDDVTHLLSLIFLGVCGLMLLIGSILVLAFSLALREKNIKRYEEKDKANKKRNSNIDSAERVAELEERVAYLEKELENRK